MKILALPSVLALVTAAAATAPGQTIIFENNFDSVTVGTYTGTAGAQFGTAAALGNASGGTNSNIDSHVAATGGVGNSRWIENPTGAARQSMQRSRNSFDFEDETSFSFYVKTGASAGNNSIIASTGWGVGDPDTGTTATAGAGGLEGGNFFSGNADYRLMLGLYGGPMSTIQLGYSHTTSGTLTPFTGGPGDTVSFAFDDNNWYQASFDLAFDGTDTWTVNDMLVRDWGSDGLTGGNTVASLATASFNPTAGASTLEGASEAWAFVASRQNGSDTSGLGVDNILITVPEPTTSVMLLGAAALLLAGRRRRA